MSTIKRIIMAILILVTKQHADAQAFTNLNFESANIPNGTEPNLLIPFDEGLPGWTGYFISSTATNQAPQAFYDGLPLTENEISIVDANVGFGFNPIQGNYSAFLCGGTAAGGTEYAAQISQSGLVPSGTESILFEAVPYYGSPFSVTLGGQAIDMSPLEVFSNYTLYGGNIASSLAGQVEMLSITAQAPPVGSPSATYFELDNIQFSSLPTPEPGVLGLLGLGGLAFLWHRRKKITAR